MRSFVWVLLLGCVPAGIDYPNPVEDSGTPPPVDAGVVADASTTPDTGTADDSGVMPTGDVSVTTNGAPIAEGELYDFGLLATGSTTTVAFEFVNGKNVPVSLTGSPLVAISGDAAFSASQPPTAVIAPGASAMFTVTVRPTTLAAVTADVVIVHDAGTFMFRVQVTARDTFIFVGVGPNGRRAISTDGSAWTNEQTFAGSADSNLFRSVGYGAGVFVALGGGQNGLMMWTENGSDWNDISDTDGWFGGVAYGNGLFVAAGANGRVLRSTNGKNWMDGSIDFIRHFRAIAFGNGIFVAVGDQGRRAVTTDGLTWTSDIQGGSRLNRVIFAEDRFIAVGDDLRRITSFDGVTWENEIGGVNALNSVAYGNGVTVAVGGIGTEVSLDRGVTWQTITGADPASTVSFGGGTFIGTGGVPGVTYLSTDGMNWTERQNTGATDYLGMTYGATR